VSGRTAALRRTEHAPPAAAGADGRQGLGGARGMGSERHGARAPRAAAAAAAASPPPPGLLTASVCAFSNISNTDS
jgi:hypothetical protein